MANHFRLYGRPLMADEVLPELTVTGVLDGYTSGEAYESRLQINNSIGRCTVEVLESTLPPGAAVRVDNLTKEVVVKWDAFTEVVDELSEVPNGGFEDGDNGQWALGNGWSIESGGAETGSFSAVFQNFKGISNIESVRVPYVPGTPIKGQARFQQGASSKGNLMGRALLIWCDANGNMLPGGEGVSFSGGNLIRSGSNAEWQTSTVTGASREAAMVAMGFSCNRRKQNKLARVDNFTWNHKYVIGQDEDRDYFLHIRVTDSLNRTADWEGYVYETTLLVTSALHPLILRTDRFTSANTLVGMKQGVMPGSASDLRTLSAGIAVVLRSATVEAFGTAEARVLSAGAVITLRSTLISGFGSDSRYIAAGPLISMRRAVIPGYGAETRSVSPAANIEMEVV